MDLQKYNMAIFIGMGIVLAILIAGILNLAFTGNKASSRSNQLMRLRVIAQFGVVVLLVIGIWFKTRAK